MTKNNQPPNAQEIEWPEDLFVPEGDEANFGWLASPPTQPTQIGYCNRCETREDEEQTTRVRLVRIAYVVNPDGSAQETRTEEAWDKNGPEETTETVYPAGTWRPVYQTPSVGSRGGRQILGRDETRYTTYWKIWRGPYWRGEAGGTYQFHAKDPLLEGRKPGPSHGTFTDKQEAEKVLAALRGREQQLTLELQEVSPADQEAEAASTRRYNDRCAEEWAAKKAHRDDIVWRLREKGYQIDGPTPPENWHNLLYGRRR